MRTFSGWLVAILLLCYLVAGRSRAAFLPGSYHGQKISFREVVQVNSLHRSQLWTEVLVRKQLETLAVTGAPPRIRKDYVRVLGQAVEKNLSKEVLGKVRASFDSDPRLWEVWRLSARSVDYAALKEKLQNLSVEQVEESHLVPSLQVERSWVSPVGLPQQALSAPLGHFLGPSLDSDRKVLTQIWLRGQADRKDWPVYLGIRNGTEFLFQEISSGPIELPGYRFQKSVLAQVLQRYFRDCLTEEPAMQTLPPLEDTFIER